MSNPFFEKSPYFGERAQRTPKGYPTYPGYTPGGQAGTTYAPPAQTRPGSYQTGYPQAGYPQPPVDDLERAYRGPAAAPADTGRMTYDDVVVKTSIVLGVIIVAAAFNWLTGASPVLTFGGALVGFVLGLVNSFKREPSRGLILAYAVAEGLFLGGISAIFNAQWEGIVLQAVLGTVATFVAALFLFRSGKVRVTPKFTKIVLVALVGYLLFSLLNVILMVTGVVTDPWGLRGVEIMGIPLGLLLGVFAVGLAAVCLIMDFDAIKRGVDQGIPGRFAWSAAFGLAVTLVWLYIEFLRLLAILRGSD
ncbi:Bax inhibitor-1/YccA family protein [Georgenia sp. SYP-B2076]|uniref:Bax inhibitor-1/YccA family protein n=1 Tax=Georgenia sp. SYP-B2076 TaxID=2495881 RepID=UPI000F8F497B|nr:Bax inhibitor-1/YccA family protein [Georgenia sp. SYP-B2076]